ncbi:hypothetical protein ACU635_27645 [[Actinomadura] parvosata]|uniref:hypothetical protein n=1 Tax=[Actinomadura] parvosata TaxID=1955412 RepID=UPI00406D2D0F
MCLTGIALNLVLETGRIDTGRLASPAPADVQLLPLLAERLALLATSSPGHYLEQNYYL